MQEGSMRLQEHSGFTLLELMVAIGVVGVLASVSMPNLGGMLQAHAAETVLNDLARTISMARASAVSQGRMVTLCRSADKTSCNGEWHNGMLVFVDRNNDRIVDDDDEVLHITPASPTPGTLKLRSFPNRQYLQFTPAGVLNNQTGNFTWCPADNNARQAQQLIFNITGRVRFAVDADQDGVREDAEGEPLSCS
jgi:prepilin-type N-terminal cleavage/methylation domain-containing protein